MELFTDIFERAAERKGDEVALLSLLTVPKSNAELSQISVDDMLAEFTRAIFKSGFIWRVIENKWQGFEEVFWNFNVDKLVLMPDDMLERKASDTKIIRNYTKVKTVRENAIWLKELNNEIQDEFASVGEWLAQWPTNDITGLWAHLKKHGSRLGGNTGPNALRRLGKDTFILSQEAEAYFRAHKIIEGGLTSKRNLAIIQGVFNQWQSESNFTLQEISQILSFSMGDNKVGFSQ